jgi:hypothetical protein
MDKAQLIYPPWYAAYIEQAGDDWHKGLVESEKQLLQTLEKLTEEQALYRYAPGKWSVKDVVQHLIDSELIFNYRALRFARQDTTPLPGFEQDDYVITAGADRHKLQDLLAHFSAVRKTTMLLFNHFTETEMLRSGEANGQTISVAALAYCNVGHCLHHLHILKERYL